MRMNKRGALEQSESGVPGWLWTIIVLALIVAGGIWVYNSTREKTDIVTGGQQTIDVQIAACNTQCNIGVGGRYAYCSEPRSLTFPDGLESDKTTCLQLATLKKATVHPTADTTEVRDVTGVNACPGLC